MTQKFSLSLKEKQLLAYLHAVDGIGQGRLTELIKLKQDRGQNLLTLWSNEGVRHKILDSKKVLSNLEKLKKEHTPTSYWQQLKTKQISLVFLTDSHYPYLLKQTAAPPPLLYLKYTQKTAIELLQAPLPIAIVGSRRMTPYGRYVTKKLTAELVAHGAVVVSGFMYGVDIQAHLTTAEAGGQTVAVLGFGFDHMFPQAHTKAFNQLLKSGNLFISQFAPHVQAHPGNFPTRNAVVAGLALGVLVTEAGVKSGSHITAQLALDEGRAVMAVPGPIDNPYSQGTKWLINEGATLVTSAKDVLQALDIKTVVEPKLIDNADPNKNLKPKFSSELEARTYQLLINQNFTTDELLAELTQLQNQPVSLTQLSNVLTRLELSGLVERVGVSWQGVRKC